MLCSYEWGLSGRYHGSIMDALRQGMGLSGRYHGSIIDTLRQRMGSEWTLA